MIDAVESVVSIELVLARVELINAKTIQGIR